MSTIPPTPPRVATKSAVKKTKDKVAAKPSVKPKTAAAVIPVAGIGASAGGLEPITEILSHVPAHTGMAFLVVQHLAPNHESILPQIIGRHTTMPVLEAKHNVAIKADHVYVIVPGVSMRLKGGKLKLSPRVKSEGKLRCIDRLFESLAVECGPRAIGVVLSGSDFDGTAGLEAIKAEGGITFAQDEQTAKFDSMPRSAVTANCVDQVLSPSDIGRELAHLALAFRAKTSLSEEETALKKGDVAPIAHILRMTKGVDFSLYKPNTFKRRIIRRAMLNRNLQMADYLAFLRAHPEEVEALYEDVLINVTTFFRDPDIFEMLKTDVFPRIIGSRSPDEPVRIWVAGCSTGQEVYSLAMAFLEFSSSAGSQIPLQIFGTDLSETVLEKARMGHFTRVQVQDLSKERLRRFFIEADGVYQVCKPIREMCIFARHNVISDPPFSRMDLVSCRNMLIYFEGPLQKKVIPIFHYALKPQGFLVLGSSETVGEHTDLFSPAYKAQRIYLKKPGTARSRLHLASMLTPLAGAAKLPAMTVVSSIENEAQREADRMALAKYAPPGVIVNASLEIIQFRGSTSHYLEPTPGKASFHVLKMAREGLLLPLRSALHRAKRDGEQVRKDHVVVHFAGKSEHVNIEVIPLKNLKDPCFLILFEPVSALHPENRRLMQEDIVRKRAGNKADAAAEIIRLQSELAAVKEYLQSVSEQHDATNEELQASNEETQSSNEELQSINEELETTKEELESTNEELRSVNDEMNQRNYELHRTNSDLHNILNGVQMCIVVLGRDLCIRRFTPLAEKILNLMSTDAGRPITNIKPNIDFPLLEQFITESVDQIRTQQTEVRDKDGRWYSLRVMPYRTLDNKIDGAVLVLVDVDALKRSEERIQATFEYARNTLETVREPLLVLSADLRVESANRSFYAKFGLHAAETTGRFIYELNGARWNIASLRLLLQEILPKNTSFEDFEMDYQSPEAGRRILLLNARQIAGEDEKSSRILLAIDDITDRRKMDSLERIVAERTSELKESLLQLEAFSYSVSHDLRGPLRSILGLAKAINEDCRDKLGNPYVDYLKRIITSSQRLDCLVTDLLIYSRTSTAALALQRVDLDELVRDALREEMFAPPAQAQITVLSPLLPVLAHATSLMRCLVNLLSNAVKFVPIGRPPQITISTERVGNEVRLVVEDNGLGIAPEHQARIVDLFERLNQGPGFEGTGIGLTIVRKTVGRMGGSVGFTSEPDKGSRFWIQLAAAPPKTE